MNEEDINKILQNMKIPEPDDSKKKATIKAAMTEFNKQKYAIQNNFKGIEDERRLTGKFRNIFNLFRRICHEKIVCYYWMRYCLYCCFSRWIVVFFCL